MPSKTVNITIDKATDLEVALTLDTYADPNSIFVQFYPNGVDEGIKTKAIDLIKKRLSDNGITASISMDENALIEIKGQPAAPDKPCDSYVMLTYAYQAMKDVKKLTRRKANIDEALTKATQMPPSNVAGPQLPFTPDDLLYREHTIKIGKAPGRKEPGLEVLLSYHEGPKERDIGVQFYPGDTEQHIKDQVINVIQQRLEDHGIRTISSGGGNSGTDDDDDDTKHLTQIIAKASSRGKPWDSSVMVGHAQQVLQEVQDTWYKKGISLYEALLEVADTPLNHVSSVSNAAWEKESPPAKGEMTADAAKQAILGVLGPVLPKAEATALADTLSRDLGMLYRTRPEIAGSEIDNRGTKDDPLYKMVAQACGGVTETKRAYVTGEIFDALHQLYKDIEAGKKPRGQSGVG